MSVRPRPWFRHSGATAIDRTPIVASPSLSAPAHARISSPSCTPMNGHSPDRYWARASSNASVEPWDNSRMLRVAGSSCRPLRSMNFIGEPRGPFMASNHPGQGFVRLCEGGPAQDGCTTPSALRVRDTFANTRAHERPLRRGLRLWCVVCGSRGWGNSYSKGRRAVLHVIERIVAPLGLRVDGSSPWVDARLSDGSRCRP